MNEPTKVPELVATLIEQKKDEIAIERIEKERLAEQKSEALIAAGREKLRTRIAQMLPLNPEWLRPYDATESVRGDEELKRVGEGYGDLNDLHLTFHIPGLAPIQFRQDRVRGTDKTVSEWRAARVRSVWDGYSAEFFKLDFTRDSYWETDLDLVLVRAEREQAEFDQHEAERQRRAADADQAEAADARRQAEADEKRADDQAAQDVEEHKLFESFKGDPVAINLLKAFLMINQERSTFESRLENADETMYSMEERWSRTAADLRRQADAAERRASEERDRASSLQYDLDDAESKLKKASRGW